MSEVHGVGGPVSSAQRAVLERQLADLARKEFGERYRDAIEAGARASYEYADGSHDHGSWDTESEAVKASYRSDTEAVLLAATTETPCPNNRDMEVGGVMKHWHPSECWACGGSAVLRVLPTTETEK